MMAYITVLCVSVFFNTKTLWFGSLTYCKLCPIGLGLTGMVSINPLLHCF